MVPDTLMNYFLASAGAGAALVGLVFVAISLSPKEMMRADCEVLAPTLKKDIRDQLIVEHWDDLNRIAASLKDGLIRPSILVSKLQSMQRQNPLQQALQELVPCQGTRFGVNGWLLRYIANSKRLKKHGTEKTAKNTGGHKI